jgi:PEP-CTERM motif
MKRVLPVLVAAVLVLSFAGPAHAINTVISQVFGGAVNLGSDIDAETLINVAGSPTTLDINDRLLGIISIQTLENLGTGTKVSLGAGTANAELTGIFDVVVTGKTPTGTVDAGGNPLFNFTFAAVPSATFNTDVAAACGGNAACLASAALLAAILTANPGTVIATFDDVSQDFSRLGTSLGADIGTAINGNLFALAGTVGANTQLTSSNLPDNVLAIAGQSPAAQIGTVVEALNRVGTSGELGTILTVPCANGPVQFCASGSLSGINAPGIVTPFAVFSNTNVEFFTVPEPGALLLLGSGLIGLGAMTFRKRVKKNS